MVRVSPAVVLAAIVAIIGIAVLAVSVASSPDRGTPTELVTVIAAIVTPTVPALLALLRAEGNSAKLEQVHEAVNGGLADRLRPVVETEVRRVIKPQLQQDRRHPPADDQAVTDVLAETSPPPRPRRH